MLRGGNGAVPEADDTLTIHCCHNELREVEVLRDHLLHLIEKHGYNNSDILVAAPDIAPFVPCIEAVFRQPVCSENSDEKYIAYSINGRSLRQSNPLADAFILLLDVGRYRYELNFIEKLLNFQEIRSCFSIEENEIGSLIQYCKEAGIRWGINGDHRKYNFPNFDNYSWQHGLDRMLLGLALTDDESFNGVWNEAVPYDRCDSPDGHNRLQNLILFLKSLQKIERDFAEPCTIEEWKERLKWLMETFFRRNMERKTHYRGLWDAINSVTSHAAHGGCEQEKIPLEVIREAVSGNIGTPEEGSSFLNGAISFSNLRDIRGIPCKVLCILGMDNGAYPRASRPDSLNVLEMQLKDEYRTVSQQDRYFFLESFLSVRDYLLIYYRGIDDASDKRYYSSALVSDLRSCAEKIFPQLKKEKKELEAGIFGLEIQHSLLPHSHKYYTILQEDWSLRNLWSFNSAERQIDKYINGNGDWLEAGFGIHNAEDNHALSVNIEPDDKKREVPEFLRKQSESFRRTDLYSEERREELRKTPLTIPLEELEEFVQNAGYTFLKTAMQFSKPKKVDETLPAVEPIHLSELDKWEIVNNKILPWLFEMEKSPEDMDTEDMANYYRRLKAENAVPIGREAELYLRELLEISWIQDENLREIWKDQNCTNQGKRVLHLDFSNDVPRIPETALKDLPERFSDLDNLPGIHYTNVKIVYETTKKKEDPYIYLSLAAQNKKHNIRAYLRHLFFNAAGECIQTHLIWKDGKAEKGKYANIGQDDARKKLRAILALYLYGQTHAVPLLCQCSTAAISTDAEEDGTPKWLKEYSKTDYNTGRQTGDDHLLEYATMLWAKDKADLKNQADLCRTIEKLARNILSGI